VRWWDEVVVHVIVAKDAGRSTDRRWQIVREGLLWMRWWDEVVVHVGTPGGFVVHTRLCLHIC